MRETICPLFPSQQPPLCHTCWEALTSRLGPFGPSTWVHTRSERDQDDVRRASPVRGKTGRSGWRWRRMHFASNLGTGLREAPGVAIKLSRKYMRPPRAGPKGTWAGCEDFGYLRVPCRANPRCKNWLKTAYNIITTSWCFVGDVLPSVIYF